jgi:hypothetical protein
MREISPRTDVSADDYVKRLPAETRRIVEEIRRQKREGTRQRPSATLIDRSAIMTKPMRDKLLDAVAALVDENYAGRAEMCLQFTALLHRALSYLKFPARSVVGTAIYYGAKGEEIWRWRHAWVRIGNEAIDGNVDSLAENPLVPKAVSVAPYWGPIAEVPADRRLREDHGAALPPDVDVDDIWWPELRSCLDVELLESDLSGGE